MTHAMLRLFALLAMLMLVAAATSSAEECSGTITEDEAVKAETDNHSSGATDNTATYIDSMRSGRVKYRTMTPNSDVKARTYGCLPIITGTAVYEVTAGGEDRTVPLRYTAIWAKRAAGIQFVSWQSTGIPKP